MQLWTVGYGVWPAPVRARRLVEALKASGITRLADVRHSPCASSIDPANRYGPRPWRLQAGPGGIAGLLGDAGIAYEWLVELGNPQRHDPRMTILRAQLADPGGNWPLHRGLERLAALVRRPGESVAIVCACAEARTCHRTLVAEALSDRHFGGALTVCEIGPGPK
jgi:hypothetical protein